MVDRVTREGSTNMVSFPADVTGRWGFNACVRCVVVSCHCVLVGDSHVAGGRVSHVAWFPRSHVAGGA